MRHHNNKFVILITMIFVLLNGCGSGSGGGGNGSGSGDNSPPEINADSISYTGLTTQASIDQSNAAYIAIGALQGGVVGTNNSVFNASTETIQVKPSRPRLLVLTKALENSVHKIKRNSSSDSVSTSDVSSEQQAESGNCGGMAYYSIEYDNVTGYLNGSETYDNYCNDGTTLRGTVIFTGLVDTNYDRYRQLNINFNPLYVADQNSTFITQGTITYDYDRIYATVLMNLLIHCNCNGRTYRYDNFRMNMTDGDGYIEFDLSGRFYEPGYGYIELSTIETFRIYNVQNWPRYGEFKFDGRSGTTVRLKILSDTAYTVEVDYEGDGLYDWSRTIDWDEDPSGENSNILPPASTG